MVTVRGTGSLYGVIEVMDFKFESIDGYCFFFSSRRRHTRFDCDWCSDVCSSDLADRIQPIPFVANCRRAYPGDARPGRAAAPTLIPEFVSQTDSHLTVAAWLYRLGHEDLAANEIGRASCRERVEISVGAVALKKT